MSAPKDSKAHRSPNASQNVQSTPIARHQKSPFVAKEFAQIPVTAPVASTQNVKLKIPNQFARVYQPTSVIRTLAVGTNAKRMTIAAHRNIVAASSVKSRATSVGRARFA